MIGKQITGKNFGGCIRYLLDKEQSAVLDALGIRSYNTLAITEDFNLQRKLNPELGKAVGHIVLSWSKEDNPKLSLAIMAERAREYMEKMGIKNTQYLTVLHTDRDHPHVHLVYNRVDNDGKTIGNYNLWEKNRKVCREMTDRYGYHLGKGKEQVNRQALRGKEQVRYQLYDALKAATTKATNWKQLEKLLQRQGIGVQYKYRSGTKEIQGVSFQRGELTFKGSAIDRRFSFAMPDRQLQQNLQVETHHGMSQANKLSLSEQIRAALETHREEQQGHRTGHGESLLEILLRPEFVPVQPDPVGDAEKRRRKRMKHEAEQSQSRHL